MAALASYLDARAHKGQWLVRMEDIDTPRKVPGASDKILQCLEACGLEWEDGCQEIHRNPTVTTTASASQVRRPIYDSSLKQWRHYESQLAGLLNQLQAAGIPAAELSAE